MTQQVQAETKRKPFYAICLNIVEDGQMVGTSIAYIHANNAQQAKYLYWASNPDRQRFQIVSVGLVIGYKVQDNQGLILSVD